jgi:REP element-mobilizing transposase RayT
MHRSRAAVPRGCPLHVTMRVRPGIPSLRSVRLVHEIRRSLAEASERGGFRVVHYTLMTDHAHWIVEATDKRALACGIKSIASRLARAVNRVFDRTGPVLDGRYDSVVLRTPRQVRHALRYVLLNARKHSRRPPKSPRLDAASSGRWFDGWREPGPSRDPIGGVREVAHARSWLLRVGWRRHGRIGRLEILGQAS